MKIRMYLACAAAVALCSACSSDEGPDDKENGGARVESRGLELSADEQEIVDAESIFAIKFFDAAYEEENMVFSPLSASCNLSLLANAATGETRTQLLEVLGCDDIESLNALNHKLLSELGALDKKNVIISMANSVWLNSLLEVSVAPEFENAATAYCAPVSSCPFDDNIHNVINGWVEDNTRQMIKSMYDKGDINKDSDLAILVNAMYFNGKFAKKFDKKNTELQKFYFIDGREEYVPMMSDDFCVPCIKNERLNACSLKFGNSAFELVLAMPKEGNSLIDAAKEALTLDKNYKKSLTISMPKFENAYTVDFGNVYNKLGIDTRGSFDNIHTAYDDIAYDIMGFKTKFRTSQKTSFKVDEDGAEGATSTSSVVGMVYADVVERMRFDHAFVYMIREKASGAIVLMGTYVK